uniref:Secreted protein n=1 Tax=Zea mays TaxID=4577 RepID=C4IZG5_MAIZE|nr:unknown [Zea mays]ACR35876.1 unknown [Zea mays]ACR36329.1 unknown [Zea mays]
MRSAAKASAGAPLLTTLLVLEKWGGGAHDEGDDTESGDGAVPAPQRPEFWRERRNGECVAAAVTDVGVPGPGDGSRPRSLRALAMTVCSSASGPKARRIISFSPWSWMSRKPMILAAWSGSSAWIRENTTLVAS